MALKKKEETESPETEAPELSKGDIEVDLSEPEEEDEPDVELEQPNGVPGTRREKKQARGRRFEEVDQRLTQAEQRAEAAERRANEAVEWARRGGGGTQQQEDPIDTESKRLEREERGLLAEFEAAKGRMTDPQHQEFIRRGREIEEGKYRVFYYREQRRNQPSQQQVQAQQEIQRFQTTYPDITSDPRYLTDCDGNYRRLVARGAAASWETIEKAVLETRSHFRLQNGHRAPDPSMRRKLQGSPKGASSAGGESPTIRLSKQDQEMALAAFPELVKKGGEAAAYKHYAKEVIQKRVMGKQKTA